MTNENAVIYKNYRSISYETYLHDNLSTNDLISIQAYA